MNGRINCIRKGYGNLFIRYTYCSCRVLQQVHEEFGELFAIKIVVFAQEIISVVTTPFILWFSLPPCASALVDFFHDFTVWVPGRGYVCSFAEFDFKRHGNVKVSQTPEIRNSY